MRLIRESIDSSIDSRIYHSSVALRFSTNAIESLNRSIKQFLGLGYLDLNKLDSQMNRFHSLKKVEATDGLKNGRLNSKRRETIPRENNIFDILKV